MNVHRVRGLVKGQTNPGVYNANNPDENDDTLQDPLVCYAFHSGDYSDLSDYNNISVIKGNKNGDLVSYCALGNATVAAGGAQVRAVQTAVRLKPSFP